MQALRSIPKVLSGIEDIQKMSSAQTQLIQYKKSVKKFIEVLTRQVSQLIENYENKIAALTQQNARLKQRPSPLKQFNTKTTRAKSPFNVQEQMASPIKLFKGLDSMNTAKSTMFTPQRVAGGVQEGQRFSSVLAKYHHADGDSNFPLELINPEPVEDATRKSRFAVKSNQKKQRDEQLRHFLETGKKNLHSTTERFLSAIGRDKQTEDNASQLQAKRDRSDSSASKKYDSLNKSLGDLYQSLDTSYVSKKARSKNKKKKEQQISEAEKKRQRDEELNKMLKDKGIKNLLQRMRDNVENSAKQAPQVIKSSKLISCGPKNTTNLSRSPTLKQSSPPQSPGLRGKRNSKVLINPVPVDIGRKSQLLKKQSMNAPVSPGRKPTSILKQSSLVLGQSLSGISAIDFN